MRSSEAIARAAHAGQLDKAGLPYTGHLGRVAARAVAHAEALSQHADLAHLVHSAGWLHDILEDTATTADDLRSECVFPLAVSAVVRLTKPKGIAYLDYIRSLVASGDPIAMIVKLADNEDNTDMARPLTATLSTSLLDRYLASAKMLRGALGIAVR